MHIEVECPQCCGTMVKRKNKKNGNEFYGCDNYPTCRQTMSLQKYAREREIKGCELVGENPAGFEIFEDMGPGDFC